MAEFEALEPQSHYVDISYAPIDVAPAAKPKNHSEWVDKLLARANLSIEALMVGELTGALDNIERIDRIITIAENRRNAMLRGIDRRRTALGEALRQQLHEVEGEFEEVIDNKPDAKTAA
jgi:hypothetical protein